jgi:peptide/nickel transport system permease protein
MSIQFVLLWSDALLFVLIAAIVALVLWARRRGQRCARPGRRVAKDGVAMAAATVLAAFVVVGLLDSLHYRGARFGAAGEPVRMRWRCTRLDALLSDLRQRGEKTYSAPLATRLYAKEALGDSANREFPRLKHGGAHLGSRSLRHGIRHRHPRLRGCAGGLVVWLLLAAAWCGCAVSEPLKWKVGHGTAMRAVTLTLLPILLLLGIAISLGGGYHVFGTDKVGQDVLYLSLKSIRTGPADRHPDHAGDAAAGGAAGHPRRLCRRLGR